MEKVIKKKLGKEWKTIVVDGNSAAVNTTVRKQFQKMKDLSTPSIKPTKSKPLIILFYFSKGSMCLRGYFKCLKTSFYLLLHCFLDIVILPRTRNIKKKTQSINVNYESSYPPRVNLCEYSNI